MRFLLGLFFVLLANGALANPAPAPVVVGIKPIAGIVAAVTEGVSEPYTLVRGNNSPHLYQLTPEDAAAMSAARLIVWVGPEMESFLTRALPAVSAKANILTLMDVDGMKVLAAREGGVWEAHDHDHEAHGHEHDHEGHEAHGHDLHEEEVELDGHIWLIPANAMRIAEVVAERLSLMDQDNAARYQANLTRFKAEMEALDKDLEAKLQPVASKPYIVFHDAYRGLEERYGLNGVGSITVSPEQQPSAARVSAIRAKIKELGPVCVFAEPEFEPPLIKTLVEGTAAKVGVLDPEGAAFDVSPRLYSQLMTGLADSLVKCLN